MAAEQSNSLQGISITTFSRTAALLAMRVARALGRRVTVEQEIVYGDGDEVGPGEQPPASKASIEALPTVETRDLVEDCVVCLEGLGGLPAKEMPCGHRYHVGCIEKWLGLHGSCPVCRFKMPGEEGERRSTTARMRMRVVSSVDMVVSSVEIEGRTRRRMGGSGGAANGDGETEGLQGGQG